MKYLTDEYIDVLRKLLVSLDRIQGILDEVEKSGVTWQAQELIELYTELFDSNILRPHFDFKISLVGKSTNSLFQVDFDTSNSVRHIHIELKSEDAIFVDALYDRRISDLLKFFKHLFSVVENFTVYRNKTRILLFQKLAGDILSDVDEFLQINIEADQSRDSRGLAPEVESKSVRIIGERFKENWQAYLNLVEEKGVQYVYHFTDESNLKSITECGGLFSWPYLERHGIEVPVPGGDKLSRDLDTKKGAQNYVRFSFCANHPMLFVMRKAKRIFKPRILKGAAELIYLEGTKFCNMNATRNEAVIDESLDYLGEFRFDLFAKFYPHLPQEEKPYYQAEILIEEFVPLRYIHNLEDPIVPR